MFCPDFELFAVLKSNAMFLWKNFQNKMSKTMRSLGKKIKGKKKTEEKDCDNDDYWNDKSIHQRTKINFDSDEVV